MPAGVRAFSIVGPRTGSDEDALTLAADAAVPLAESHRAGGGAISGVLFATSDSGPPVRLLAEACDVPFERLRTTELRGPRAALQGVLAACERLAADRESADALLAAGGDAAGAALLIGRGALVAELLGSHSVTGEDFVAISRAAIAGALTNANTQIRDVAHFAIGAPSEDSARRLLEVCGVDPARLAPFAHESGVAQPLLSFAAALEASARGELLVLSGWGDGADALVFRALADAPRPARRPQRTAPRPPPPAGAAEPDRDLRLRGATCRHCGVLRHPARPTCAACGREGADATRLPRFGVVRDPASRVIELDGGARVSLPFAASFAAGDRVELRVRCAGPGYAWKACAAS